LLQPRLPEQPLKRVLLQPLQLPLLTLNSRLLLSPCLMLPPPLNLQAVKEVQAGLLEMMRIMA
jgi:hypothetical protein